MINNFIKKYIKNHLSSRYIEISIFISKPFQGRLNLYLDK